MRFSGQGFFNWLYESTRQEIDFCHVALTTFYFVQFCVFVYKIRTCTNIFYVGFWLNTNVIALYTDTFRVLKSLKLYYKKKTRRTNLVRLFNSCKTKHSWKNIAPINLLIVCNSDVEQKRPKKSKLCLRLIVE